MRLGLRSWSSNSRWQVGEKTELAYRFAFDLCTGIQDVNPSMNTENVYSSPFMVSFTDKQDQSAFSNKESVQNVVKASLSQKATLSCEVADTKREVKWYKDGKLLTPSKTVHTESKGKSRQLVIDSMEKKDAGEYMCEAGTEKLVFRVQVEGNDYQRKIINKSLLTGRHFTT